jgi:hypothetical protein
MTHAQHQKLPHSDEIIRQSMIGKTDDPDAFVHGVAEYMKQTKGSFAVQVQDTVFLCEPRDQGGMEIHIFTTQKNPQKLADQIVHLGSELKRSGVNYMFGETDDPAIIRVCELTKLPTQKKVIPGEDGQPMYQIRVELTQ